MPFNKVAKFECCGSFMSLFAIYLVNIANEGLDLLRVTNNLPLGNLLF